MALRRKLLVSALLTLAMTAGATPSADAATAAAAPTTAWRFLDLTTHDGVRLKANLITPTTPGPHPALVFVSSWGLNDAQYLVQAKRFAQAGYVVLSYTTRGFWSSGGHVETAGPADIADVSAAIDWLDANTDADPTRIGVGGVSYGAGISLIAAARDRRIRAVAAMSAWSDLVESLYGGQTRRPQAVWLLRTAAQLLGRPSEEFNRLAEDYFANRNVPGLITWAELRSARTYLAGLRANAPAVLIAHTYGDSIFPPNQMVDLFTALTGPKRLEMTAGDHAIPELTGLAGLPNHVWTSTRRWFDEHLAGVDTGIAREPVVLRVRNSAAVEPYRDWADVTGATQRYHLGGTPGWNPTGALTNTPSGGWTESFRATGDTVADGGVVMLSNGLEALTGIPPLAWLPAVDRRRGAVWSTGALPRGAAVRGVPRLRLAVTPAAPTGTLVSYLYDVDALGTGRLVTHAPISWTEARPGTPLTLDVALPATAWDVPAGHRLALVVDTEDPLYLDVNPHGATISVGAGSWIDVPLR
ncbi:X-Pro dipeptidyl-peptidase C-terminal non-catalytic domain-containing protein [Micromonospora pattaloongensis]|uniref:X-Pro dipeptidyl-peptidase C-terminal non-catalytic domain-containing protein n=1 Tax=Micromonospora pattaloongensis TaxID=405436 RepID=A0A1H3JF14_9ACTN|nr:CocE/NonD family hydrolase [Micromonospora pattaloongensis]SDY38573.1 X-Pro dipeptidyl-peptidase C-terminal non-catalytic domain-containing protein [Micromonospora pattaloongensis]